MSEIRDLFELSEQALDDAVLLSGRGSLRAAQNRIYYALFYAAKAALLSLGEEPVTHRGVVALFGQEVVKSGLASREDGRFLADEQRKRYEADYEPETAFEPEEIEVSIERAQAFIGGMENLVNEGKGDT